MTSAFDKELGVVLDELESAENYKAWLLELSAPFLRGRILEIGAGRGTYSVELRSHGESLTAIEPAGDACAILRDRLRDLDGVVVRHATVDALAGSTFDAAVALNVLEHVEDDAAMLRDVFELLVPGGHFVIWVPAFPALLGRFDRAIGHHRRYRRHALDSLVREAGYDLVVSQYQNLPGFFAWFLIIRLLGRRPTSGGLSSVFDRFVVPIVRRFESRVSVPFGQSLFVVGRRPAAPHAGKDDVAASAGLPTTPHLG